MRLVLIEWVVDSHGTLEGWQILDKDEISAEPLNCHSVGWLSHDGEDCKTIIPHIGGIESNHLPLQGRCNLTIPTKAILKLSELEESS